MWGGHTCPGDGGKIKDPGEQRAESACALGLYERYDGLYISMYSTWSGEIFSRSVRRRKKFGEQRVFMPVRLPCFSEKQRHPDQEMPSHDL